MASDRDAIEELRGVSDVQASHLVRHYLYFPQESVSKRGAALLAERGCEVENRFGADGINWLVLVTCHVVPTEARISQMREGMEQVAREHSGEYDGWEAQVQK